MSYLTNVVALAALIFSLQPSYAVAEPQTVIVFGDSIAEGGALPKEERAQAWVNRVQAEAGDRLVVLNESKGGRPTNSVGEFEAMLKRRPRADVLVIALGTNDSRDVSDQCVPKAVRNVRTMVELARQTYGDRLRVLLVGPPNIRKDALGPTKPIADQRESKLKELNATFETLAKDLGCEFVSLFGLVPDASLAKDGVHPDGAGNAPIARAILPKLLPADR